MKIIANDCSEFEVPDDHPALSQGIFLMLDFRDNSGLERDFLNFVFFGQSEKPLEHAKIASTNGLTDLAKEIFLKHISERKLTESTLDDKVIEELRNLFAWNELPDWCASEILVNPGPEDLTEIVRLKYFLCYKKFARIMKDYNYKYLGTDFLDTVIGEIGVQSSFHVCCSNGHQIMAEYIEAIFHDEIRQEMDLALYVATANGHLETVRYLVPILKSISSKSLNDYRHNPLLKAVENGDLEMVKFFISNGADPRAYRNSPLLQAAKSGHMHLVLYLESVGADPGLFANNALRYSAENGNLEMVKHFISHGADMIYNGNEALALAAKGGHIPVAKYLISTNRVDVNASRGMAMIFASSGGHLDMVKFLVSEGADLKVSKDYPIIDAAREGHIDVVEYLISIGADVDAEYGFPLNNAAERGDLEMVSFLIKAGANVLCEENLPLVSAAENGHLDVAKLLVKSGADVKKCKNRAIRRAAINGQIEMVRYLVSAGANPMACKGTTMKKVAKSKHLNTIAYLKTLGVPAP